MSTNAHSTLSEEVIPFRVIYKLDIIIYTEVTYDTCFFSQAIYYSPFC